MGNENQEDGQDVAEETKNVVNGGPENVHDPNEPIEPNEPVGGLVNNAVDNNPNNENEVEERPVGDIENHKADADGEAEKVENEVEMPHGVEEVQKAEGEVVDEKANEDVNGEENEVEV